MNPDPDMPRQYEDSPAPPRPAARMAPADAGHAERLAAFREQHPEVKVRDIGFSHTWQATWEPAGAVEVITRHVLGDLLDALDAVFGPAA